MAKIQYLTYNEAQLFSSNLGLKSDKEWYLYCKSGNKPANIPTSVDKIYKNKGWNGWGHWTGTGNLPKLKINYISFEESKTFVQKLKLKNTTQWKEYCKFGNKPNNIPAAPDKTYKNKGWISFGDWFGTNKGARGRNFLCYEEAKEFVHKIKIENESKWKEYAKSGNRPPNIPANPYLIYKNKGWISIGDWLGGKNKKLTKSDFLNFKDAKIFIHNLKLKSFEEWNEYKKPENRPKNIPSNPHTFYKNDGWISLEDWLGYEKRCFLPFEEVRNFARTLKFKSSEQWEKYCKINNIKNMPITPNNVYKNKGWISWGDFLGKTKKNLNL